MFSIEIVFFLGFILLIIVSIFFFLTLSRKITKKSKEFEDVEKNVELDIDEYELINRLNESIADYLDNIGVLDEMIEFVGENVSISSGGFVIRENNSLIFKTHLMVELPQSFVDEFKNKMMNDFATESKSSIDDYSFEQFIEGGPINNQSSLGLHSYLSIPIRLEAGLLGIFGIASTKENLYNDSVKESIKKVLDSGVGFIEKIKVVVEREKGKLQAMVDSMNDGVMLLDKNYKILVVNPFVHNLLDTKLGATINVLEVSEYFSVGEFSLEEQISKVLATGSFEVFSGIQKNDRYFEIVLIPVKSKGDTIGVGVIIHDQTKEEELKRLQRDFSAMVIHELRSPLSVIRGTSDLLSKQIGNFNQKQVVEFTSQIKESSENLLTMVNDLLDAAKVESGKIELFKQDIDFKALLEDEVRFYLNLARQRNMKLDLSIPDSVRILKIDGKKVRQVLNNLISNALKFTSDDGSITVSVEDMGDKVKLIVADTGSGVPDNVKEKIFKKYIQGQDFGKQKGTGLGLVIAKGIIEAHGGDIWVEDNEPVGARFIFTLPKK